MKKSGIFLLTLSVLFLLPFISAQFGFGFYGFSLEGLIESFLNSSTSAYVLIFFALFTVITLALSRSNLFKDRYGQPNAIAAGTVSFSVSALAVYYLYQAGFQGESLLSWVGFSSDAIYPVLSIILLLFALFVFYLFGRRTTMTNAGPVRTWSLWGALAGLFLVTGLALIIFAFTDLIYEKGIAVIIGVAMILASLFFWNWSRKALMRAGGWAKSHYSWEREKRQMGIGTPLIILGVLITIFGVGTGVSMIAIIGFVIAIIGVGIFAFRNIFGRDRIPGPITDPRRLLPPGRG